MDGIQKTVHDGLICLANKVAAGVYGEDDDAFQDVKRKAFYDDLMDEVENKLD